MHEAQRTPDGHSFHDQPIHGFPRRRVIWSCDAARGPLLTRYYLLDTRLVAIYLHHLHASDEDRALHDHPWSFVTFLLSSGYWEWVPNDDVGEAIAMGPTVGLWRRRFSVLYRPAEWRHRLQLVKPCWTLVLRWRRRREWGFITPTGWLDWRSYGKDWCD